MCRRTNLFKSLSHGFSVSSGNGCGADGGGADGDGGRRHRDGCG